MIVDDTTLQSLDPVLYISYDGMLESLGQSQVLCYLESLARHRRIYLISFEKPADLALSRLKASIADRISNAGIDWYPIRYHKRFSLLATLFDVSVGALCALRIILRQNIRIVHARSYVAAVIALTLNTLLGIRFIFDMRGFFPNERVDGGLWQPTSLVFRLAKRFEKIFLRRADFVISLTNAAVPELRRMQIYKHGFPQTVVIPTCADLERFKPVLRAHYPRLVGYVGTVGRWYLFEPVAYCFARLSVMRPDLRFLILNQKEHVQIRECLSAAGVPMDRVDLRSVAFEEIPQWVSMMSASIFFTKQVFSVKAAAPTRLAELLGCGVPCLTNTGVGDMEEQLAELKCGVTVSSFDPSALNAGLDALLQLMAEPNIVQRCRETALRHFSLEEGVKRYAAVYASLGLQPKRT